MTICNYMLELDQDVKLMLTCLLICLKMKEIMENHIFQLHASNTFQSIKRGVLLHNMNILCQEFATNVYNFVKL